MVDVMKKTDRMVKSLQDELDNRQKKKFTDWINYILREEEMKVDDLFLDLSDGQKLTKLLELVSGEKFIRLARGKSRMHNIENVSKCLAFLRTKVPLPSIGAEDIVDGNHRLILGLVWTIMHGFPTKKENDQEILLTSPLQDEKTTRLHELITSVHQEPLKVQQNTSSVIVEREAVDVPEDNQVQHGFPTKKENDQELLLTSPLQDEKTTRLHELIASVHQKPLKVQQNTSSVIVERESVDVPEGNQVLQHTTYVFQVKRDTATGKGDNEVHLNTVPMEREENNEVGIRISAGSHLVQNYDALHNSQIRESLIIQEQPLQNVDTQKNELEAQKSFEKIHLGELNQSKEQQKKIQGKCREQKTETLEMTLEKLKAQHQKAAEQVEKADDIDEVELLQQTQQESEAEVGSNHLINTKQREIGEDKKSNILYQFQSLKQSKMQDETTDQCKNCAEQQRVEETNEVGELSKEHLIEQANEDMPNIKQYQYKPEKADELGVVQNDIKESEPVQDNKKIKMELEHYRKIDSYELHLSEKEKDDQNLKQKGEELVMKEAGNSYKLQSSEYDEKQDNKGNRQLDFLQNKKEEETDDLHETHLTEQKQELDHQNIIELNRFHKEEVGELGKLLPIKLNQQQDHGESEIKQKYIEVDHGHLGIQNQETVEQSQNKNDIEKTSQGSPKVDSNEESKFEYEYGSDYDDYNQAGTTSLSFLQELRHECKRRHLLKRKQEDEGKEVQRSEYYEILEQSSQVQAPMEPEHDDMKDNLDEEKLKQQLWKKREVERLQEEAKKHREELKIQEQLKCEREEEERQKQPSADNGQASHEGLLFSEQDLIQQLRQIQNHVINQEKL